FLVGKSPADRKQIYLTGLDILNANARKRFNKAFAEVDDKQAGELLAPLREPWTYNPPSDPLTRFLRDAKADIRNATVNSREYSTAGSAGSRRGGGVGQYWFPID
ncbi:MAG: gluconate 2-dehydrogenase subunit 3 family protein, partial [Blastocatellia bacterium]